MVYDVIRRKAKTVINAWGYGREDVTVGMHL